MFQRFNRINLKYGVAFAGVALSLVVVVTVNFMLVNAVKERMLAFSGVFNVAISDVLNADRDLYQARVAEVALLSSDTSASDREASLADFEENAQQAYDRMQEFADRMTPYPDVVASLEEFESRFTAWRNTAEQVFTLDASGDEAAVASLMNGESLQRFDALREIYNAAGEAADAKVAELEARTLSQIQRQQWVVGVFVAVVSLVALAIALVGPQLMSRAIRQVSERIREITEGDGDLTSRIRSDRGDEIGELAERFNAFIARMDDTLLQVRDSAERVAGVSGEIARGSQELAARTEQSSANLQETAASMEEITTTVRNTSDATRHADRLVGETVDVARRGQSAMGEVESTMGQISDAAARINEIITLIDGIAFQTNILALNASVEAARAGEHGRGFAVVAQEVRTLAGRSADASREIRALVDASVNSTQAGSKLVANAGRTMGEIMASIDEVTRVIAEISTGAEEQSHGIGQINIAVTELDTMTQHNAGMVEETSNAAEQMRKQAMDLSALLASFRLSGDRQQASAEGAAKSSGSHATELRSISRPAADKRIDHRRVA